MVMAQPNSVVRVNLALKCPQKEVHSVSGLAAVQHYRPSFAAYCQVQAEDSNWLDMEQELLKLRHLIVGEM